MAMKKDWTVCKYSTQLNRPALFFRHLYLVNSQTFDYCHGTPMPYCLTAMRVLFSTLTTGLGKKENNFRWAQEQLTLESFLKMNESLLSTDRHWSLE